MTNNQGIWLVIVLALLGAFLAPHWSFSLCYFIIAVIAPYSLEDEEDEKVDDDRNGL